MRRSLKFVLAFAAAGLGVAAPASAQTTGSINATVTVLSALSISGNPLAFGNVAPTQTKSVPATAGGAGTFTISGASGAPVAFSITSLPANFGSATLALGSWTGISNSQNSPTAGTPANFTPATGYSANFTLNATGNYYVYLGATLTAAGATPGNYSAPINVSVVYN